jgi:hypothetical protein
MSAAELTQIDLTAQQYADSITSGWEKYIQSEERQTPSRRQYTYAGSYESCDRKLVLLMTDGEKVIPFQTETLAKFHRGKDRERNMIIDLTRVGQHSNPTFEVIGQQERFELRDHKQRVAIVGKVDLRLFFGRNLPCPPVEVKDWDVHLTDRIKTFDDVFENQWTKKGGYQLLAYLFAAGESFGFLLLPRPGLPRLLPVELLPNLGRMEEFLSKAERSLDHREAGTLPDYIQDAAECKRCQFFGSVCNPPIMSGEGATVITDPEIETMLERRQELEGAADEYEKIDKRIKAQFRGIEQGICGPFILQGKYGKQTSYEVPEEIKKQYAKVDPKGRFTLTITKV